MGKILLTITLSLLFISLVYAKQNIYLINSNFAKPEPIWTSPDNMENYKLTYVNDKLGKVYWNNAPIPITGTYEFNNINLPKGHYIIEFKMYYIDSWDGSIVTNPIENNFDYVVLKINTKNTKVLSFDWVANPHNYLYAQQCCQGVLSRVDSNDGGIDYIKKLFNNGIYTDLDYYYKWRSSCHTTIENVKIKYNNNIKSISFYAHSNLQGIDDESWTISQIKIFRESSVQIL